MSRLPTLLLALLLAACGGKVSEPPQPSLTVVGAASVDFGITLAGTAKAREVTLANDAHDGRDVDPLESIVVAVSGAGLSVEHDCPSTLGSGASCTITIVAEPATSGAISGTLVVLSNAQGSPLTLPVTGSAVAALSPPQAAFAWQTGASGDFGEVAVGSSSSRGIGVVNRGNAAGPVQITLSAAGGAWTVSDDCSGNILPGATCTATVTFAPAAVGLAEGRLVLTDGYHQGFAETRLALGGSGR